MNNPQGITINNVTKHFGQTAALDGVSLHIQPGQITGLLGNNGAGKSTLLSIITNRLYPDSGDVLIDGEPVGDNDHALGKVFLMSEHNLYPEDIKVGKAFELTCLFYPDFDKAKAYDLAKRFGLNTRKKITTLSTGYSSIFRLILALTVNTPYMLLDEPVLGLDAQHRDMFYKMLIEKYSESACTILISTHLIQEVENLIEHTIIISNGRIIKDMPRSQLLENGYTISGPAALVDQYLSGREVLSVSALGGLKTASIQGKPESSQLPAGLEIGHLGLQEYFIQLMNKEEQQ